MIKAFIAKYDDRINAAVQDVEILDKLQENTNMKKSHIVLGLIVLSYVFFYVFIGMSFVCNLVGFVYPCYMSFKCIEHKKNEGAQHWLTYLSVFEVFVGFIMAWVPYYYTLKLLFLIFCFHPDYKGSSRVYSLFLRPLLVRYEAQVDSSVALAREKVERASELAKNSVSGAIDDVVETVSKSAIKSSLSGTNKKTE